MVGQRSRDAINVHSRHCEQVKGIHEDKKIRLEWKHLDLKQQLEIDLQDRTGIFADILSTLASNDIRVSSINTKAAKRNLRMLLQISSDQDKLEKTIPKLKQVRNVISVKAT